MKTQRERREEKRQERLSEIDSQIEAGTLVVRQMTPEERARPVRVDRRSTSSTGGSGNRSPARRS